MCENFWGNNNNFQINTEKTDSIHTIMETQCKYLSQLTQNKVCAIFGEVKAGGSFIKSLSCVVDALKFVTGKTALKETVGELSTDELIDANGMYFETKYAFEVYTNTYKLRLFELIMTPTYPIDIIVDEGINNDISNRLSDLENADNKNNCYRIYRENEFCRIIKMVFQNRKVQYIINELVRINDEEALKDSKELSKKIILCEGQTDEIILQALAKKLKCSITTVISDEKNRIPTFLNKIKEKNENSEILVVVNSDGDEDETRSFIEEKVGNDFYELAIINNQIEDWFSFGKADFSKLNLIQSIDTIIENFDIEKKQKEDKAFNTIVEFMRRQP